MNLAMLALPAAIATASLYTPPAEAQARELYRASGTEPFWSLEIGRNSIVFRPMEGRPTTVAKPRAAAVRNGEAYRARGMTVDITHRRCSDGMSDRTYRDTVKVTIGRRTFAGCGGAITEGNQSAGNLLSGTNWRIDAINGRPVRLDRPVTVRFTRDRIEGKICNAFGGRYSFTRGTLTTREVIATQMACGGSLGETETAFLRALALPARVSQSDRDTLRLTSGRVSVTLRRAR